MLSASKSDDVNELQENVWSKRQWMVLIATFTAVFGCAICFSLQAPFFPVEAERKHVQSTTQGFIFGAFSLTIFIMSPIFGKYIGEIGLLFMLNSGTFVTASCCILFGFLDQMRSASSFTTFAFIIRVLEATGEAAVMTSSYSRVAQTFPGEISKAFAVLRAAFGIGLTIGPTIGGLLYELGGFTLPFVSMGGLLLAIATVNTVIFWPENEEYVAAPKSTNISHALSIPSVTLSVVAAGMCAVSIGFMETTLEPHLRQFNVTPVVIGLVFLTTAASEAVGYAFLAWFTDGKQYLKPIIACGHFFICITYLAMGPAPFIPFASQFWINVVAMAFNGLGLGAVFLASHVEAIQASVLNGFPDTFQTYGLISGIWTAFVEFGHFLGPSLSGVTYDELGYRLASQIPLSLQLIMVVANIFYYFVYDRPVKKLKNSSLSSSLVIMDKKVACIN